MKISFFILENFLLITVTLMISAGLVSPLIKQHLPRIFTANLPWICATVLVLAPVAVKLLSKSKINFQLSGYYPAILALVVYWCIAGLSFTLYLDAFPALALGTTTGETAGIYIFSWCLGYLALFAPQGIGVSEFVSGYLLAGSQAAQILGFLLGFRLIVLLADLACWALSVLLKGRI